jgi:pimeloyl-ACP methyl ester carboxylesterase
MRRAIIALAVLVTAVTAAALYAGEVFTSPATRSVGLPPNNLAVEPVAFENPPEGIVKGWFSRGKPGFGGVLLLHGVRSSRRQMVRRARFLHAEGYSVLLIDLPAHGESSGERITFGYREASGVRTAMKFLRQALPGERTAVIGVSMGAASLVFSDEKPAPDAVVLESMYPTIEEAVVDRLKIRLGSFGGIFAPPFLWQLRLWTGVSSDRLNPIEHLASLHAPVLIVAGTEDRDTPVAETKRLFATAAVPKELWLVPGAAHVDLHAFSPKAYEEKISAFLGKYLQHPSPLMAHSDR